MKLPKDGLSTQSSETEGGKGREVGKANILHCTFKV